MAAVTGVVCAAALVPLVVVVDFNRPTPVRHRGSGIFLHVNGQGATAGCVSTPKWFVRKAMKRLDPSRKSLIAIGR